MKPGTKQWCILAGDAIKAMEEVAWNTPRPLVRSEARRLHAALARREKALLKQP